MLSRKSWKKAYPELYALEVDDFRKAVRLLGR
jgi:hypothetical protein